MTSDPRRGTSKTESCRVLNQVKIENGDIFAGLSKAWVELNAAAFGFGPARPSALPACLALALHFFSRVWLHKSRHVGVGWVGREGRYVEDMSSRHDMRA